MEHSICITFHETVLRVSVLRVVSIRVSVGSVVFVSHFIDSMNSLSGKAICSRYLCIFGVFMVVLVCGSTHCGSAKKIIDC